MSNVTQGVKKDSKTSFVAYAAETTDDRTKVEHTWNLLNKRFPCKTEIKLRSWCMEHVSYQYSININKMLYCIVLSSINWARYANRSTFTISSRIDSKNESLSQAMSVTKFFYSQDRLKTFHPRLSPNNKSSDPCNCSSRWLNMTTTSAAKWDLIIPESPWLRRLFGKKRKVNLLIKER